MASFVQTHGFKPVGPSVCNRRQKHMREEKKGFVLPSPLLMQLYLAIKS